MSTGLIRSKSIIIKPIKMRPSLKIKQSRKVCKENEKHKFNYTTVEKTIKSAQHEISNISISPRSMIFTQKSAIMQVSALVSKLDAFNNKPFNEKFSVAQSILTELTIIRPELFIVISKIKEIIQDYDANMKMIRENCDTKCKVAAEDFKRLNKRYKNMAFEVLELQAKLKKRRNMVYELRKENKQKCEEISLKCKEVSLLNEKVKELEQNIKMECERLNGKGPWNITVRNCLTASLAPPFIDSARFSSIDVMAGADISQYNIDELNFSPLLDSSRLT